VTLAVFGAGDDAQPIVRMARELGWRVVVADKRPAFATRDRFPGAHRVLAMRPEEALRAIPLTARTAAVCVTHSFADDVALLPALLASPAFYVALLGPRHRTKRLLNELTHRGAELNDDALRRLRSPAGLDLGSGSPHEIALSIIAEIVAVQNERDGGPLRERTATIHEPPAREVRVVEGATAPLVADGAART
jgi:xanthine dehydrogenase accessory factor